MRQSYAIKSVLILALTVAIALPPLHGGDLGGDDRRSFADGLMARGLYAMALKEYAALADSATGENGRDIILSRLAECQRRTGDYAAADATCSIFEREFPSSPQRFQTAITHALALSAQGNLLKASRMFDIIAADSDAPADLRFSALFHSGENFFNAGEKDAAKSRFAMLVSQSASGDVSPLIRELLGYASLYVAELEADGDSDDSVDKSLAAYDALVDNPPTPRIGAEALFKGAMTAYKAKRYDDAAARFASLSAKYPHDSRVADARLPSAWANFHAGRYREAAELAASFLATAKPIDSTLRAEAMYLRATALARLGDSTTALESYSSMLAEFPNSRYSPFARYERLAILYKANRFKEVLAEAATIVDPPAGLAPDILWVQAEAAEALDDATRASQFYAMLATRHPASPLAAESLYRSARHLRNSKSWLEAAKMLQRIPLEHSDSPLHPYALYESGCCLSLAGRHEEAVRDFESLFSKFPKHALEPDALLQYAVALRSLGRIRDAGAALDRLMTSYPASSAAAVASFERARIFYESGEYARAEALLVPYIASAATPESARDASFLLGLVFHAQGRDAEAAAQFQPLLEGALRSKLPLERLVWLAEFQSSQGRHQETIDVGRELLARHLSDEMRQSVNVLVARSQLALCSTNDAVSSFRAAAESPARTRFSAEAALRLAELLAAAGNSAAAIPWFRQAIERAGGVGEGADSIKARAYIGLAAAYEAENNLDEALRLYLAVSLLFDGGDEVHNAMIAAERLLRASGADDEANALQKERLSRFPEVDP